MAAAEHVRELHPEMKRITFVDTPRTAQFIFAGAGGDSHYSKARRFVGRVAGNQEKSLTDHRPPWDSSFAPSRWTMQTRLQPLDRVKNLRASEPQGKYQIRRETGTLYMKNAIMRNVAGVTASPLGNMPIENVVDDTGISERSDLTLDFRDFNPKDAEFHNYVEMRAALFDFASRALEPAYGLKLERRKLPIEFLIVGSGNKIRTQNSEGPHCTSRLSLNVNYTSNYAYNRSPVGLF